MEKPTQMFSVIKYQKNVLNLFVDLQFWSILLLEQVQIIKCLSKNVSMLLKKKKMPEYITGEIEDSDEENSNEESSDEEN